MSFDIATAKTRLGLWDGSQDAIAQTCVDASLALAETWCDRKFMHSPEVEGFTHVAAALSLRRYPIDRSMTPTVKRDGQTVETCSFDYLAGLVDVGSGPGEYSVAYLGGYLELPADLELALWSIFDAVWAASPGGGRALGATVTATVKSISSPDIGSVSYFDPGSPSSTGGLIPPMAVGILDLYRRKDC